jgi:hypothetical protein
VVNAHQPRGRRACRLSPVYSVYVYDGHGGYMECAELVADVCGTTWRDALDRGMEMAKEALSGRENLAMGPPKRRAFAEVAWAPTPVAPCRRSSPRGQLSLPHLWALIPADFSDNGHSDDAGFHLIFP